MDQLQKLEEVNPNMMGKYNTGIENKYQFDSFDLLCSEIGKRKINSMDTLV